MRSIWEMILGCAITLVMLYVVWAVIFNDDDDES